MVTQKKCAVPSAACEVPVRSAKCGVLVPSAECGVRNAESRERGFTLIEVLVATAVSTIVLGAAVALTIAAQRGYTSQMQDAGIQQEARYTLEWIASVLRSAGSNTYSITTTQCPAANTAFQAIRMDPDGDGSNDDIRVQADINPTNGVAGGVAGACTEATEDITIAHNPATLEITRQDMNVDAAPVAMTDPIFTQLQFTYLDFNRVVTAVPAQVAYVVVSVTGRSRVRNSYTGAFTTYTLQTEVRLRAR
jgi:prepilin-type N-terminal cleavage/methylation domain-containing protein